jgi:hypothetical protein
MSLYKIFHEMFRTYVKVSNKQNWRYVDLVIKVYSKCLCERIVETKNRGSKKKEIVKEKKITPHRRKIGTVENSSFTTNKPGTVSSLFRS